MRSTPRLASWCARATGSCSRARTCSSARARRMPPRPIEPFAAKGKAELVRAARRSAPPSASASRRRSGRSSVARPSSTTLLAALRLARARGRAPSRSSPGVRASARRACWASSARRRQGRARCASSARQTGANHPYCGDRARSCGARCSSTRTRRTRDVERRLRASSRERAPELEPWLPLLGVVVGLSSAADAGERRRSRSASSPSASRRVVEELLDAVVPDAALVVIDDAHFMDEASAALVGHSPRGVARAPLAARRRPARATATAFDAPRGRRGRAGAARAARARGRALLVVAADRGRAAPGARRRDDRGALRRQPAVRHRDGRARCAAGADHDTLPESVEALMALADRRAGGRRPRASCGRPRSWARASRAPAWWPRSSSTRRMPRRSSSASAASSTPTATAASRSATGCCATPPTTGSRSAAGARCIAGWASRSSWARTATSRPSRRDLTHHFFEAGVWEKSLRYGHRRRRRGARASTRTSMRRACSTARSRPARAGAARAPRRSCWPPRRSATCGSRSASSSARAPPSCVARRRVRGDAVERARLLRKEAVVAHRLGEFAEAQRTLIRALGACSRTSAAFRPRHSAPASRRCSASSPSGAGDRATRSAG